MDKPFIICLVPVKNEAWILDRFIQCASLWADHIIIADQMSTDGSRDIALKYPKVVLLNNLNHTYDEQQRQRLLIDKARQIGSNGRRKLFITLDADEFLTANFNESSEWSNILEAPIGTIIYFSWINIKPDFKQYWEGGSFGWGFIDDGISTNERSIIHNHRIPKPENAHKLICQEIKVLHYQYTDWQRMQSKHRWYQCFELLNRKHQHPITIFRIYHHMYGLSKSQFQALKIEWFDYYEKHGIDMFYVKKENSYYWDKLVEVYFEKYGTCHFASLNIWQKTTSKFPDPRNAMQKILHRYLLWSQIYFTQKFPIGTCVRYFDKFLIWIF